MTKKQKKMLVRILITAAMLIALHFIPITGIPQLIAYLAAYAVIGYDILRKAGKGIANRQPFDENFLMALATLGREAESRHVGQVFRRRQSLRQLRQRHEGGRAGAGRQRAGRQQQGRQRGRGGGPGHGVMMPGRRAKGNCRRQPGARRLLRTGAAAGAGLVPALSKEGRGGHEKSPQARGLRADCWRDGGGV